MTYLYSAPPFLSSLYNECLKEISSYIINVLENPHSLSGYFSDKLKYYYSNWNIL